MFDFRKRIEKACQAMLENKIEVMFLNQGANLFYLTGISRTDKQGTETHSHGDWANGAFFFSNGKVVVCSPRAGMGRHVGLEGMEKPWVDSVELFVEGEDPLSIISKILSGTKWNGKSLAIDDRSWSTTVLALQSITPGVPLTLASEILKPMRMTKEPAEIEMMRKAGEITGQVFEKVVKMLKPGIAELDVASEVDYQFKKHGAQFSSFATGIRFVGPGRPFVYGPQRSGAKQLTPGDTITFDMGCVYEGYCSDFGRSAYVGEPTKELLKIHEVVLESEKAGMKTLKPGSTANQVIAAVQELIMSYGYEQDLKHAVGHAIGINVHEEPTLSYIDTSPILNNMTFALEPSVRTEEIGNRVEDVVVVEENGASHLFTTDRRLYIVDA